jgi:RNA polymerase sigma factor (sigma-70 family)
VSGVQRSGVPPFQEFLDLNRRAVYRFLTVAVGPADADDAFQETFLAALRAYPRLTDGSKLDRWILTIASRKAIDHHRGTARRAIPSERLPEAATLDAHHDPSDPLWAGVAALPPRQRVAVVHRHVLDRSYADIAELMECTEQTARANVYQGTKRLRELMT